MLGLSGSLSDAWNSPPSTGPAPSTITKTTVRIFNRLNGATFTFSETQAKAQAATTASLSSTILAENSHIDYECDPAASETGQIFEATDGAVFSKTFQIKCSQVSSVKQADVNWGTLSTITDVYMSPIQ